MRASELGNEKLVIFDIDDTLVNTDTRVNVVRDGKTIKQLNSHDFTHYKLQPGEEFDFGAFKDAREFFTQARPIPGMIRQLKRDIATGNRVIMLTARSDFNDRDVFLDTFRRFGIDMDRVHVYRAGNLAIKAATEEKKKIILRHLLGKEHFDKLIMYDDSVPNLNAFLSLRQEYPWSKFYAWHVDPNGQATEYSRAVNELFDRPVKDRPATARTRSRFVSQVGDHEVEVFFKNTDRGLEINFAVDGRGFALEKERGKPSSQQALTSAIKMILARLPEVVDYYKPKRVWYKALSMTPSRVKLYDRLLPLLQRVLGPEWRASTEQHPGWNLYYLDRQQKLKEAQQATAKQVLAYINKTHHEPMTDKLARAVLAHPQWELVKVPLLNLNIPDQEYDDVDYDENEPEADPYGRVMMVEPEHAGEVSMQLIDRKPIVIDADRYIIDGNHRAWAAKYLLNRDYIQAWRPVAQVNEVNYPDELTVSDRIQEYFFNRGYELAGEGRDQMAFESPRGTIVKVLGTGDPEREKIVLDYVKFFEQNQRNPFYPRIYNSGYFDIDDERYFVYEMERVNYVANEEATLDYIEKLMSAVDRGRGPEFVKQNPVPAEIGQRQLTGLLQATEHMVQALGGQAPLDLSAVENLGRRNNGHLVIVDPYSL
jgi:hypothetical protein